MKDAYSTEIILETQESNLGFANHANIHGRGALENPTGRFEPIEVVYDCDDPNAAEYYEGKLKTKYFKDHTKSILATNDSPDVCFNFSINPYRGCEHGCIYCFARPTHEYLGLSCGLDFESKIFVKTDAATLLQKKLASKSWQPQPIILSGVTDPYQPAERYFKVTRQCLEVLTECRNPVGIITKNALVTRDIDLLGELAKHQCVNVMLSITSLDPSLARIMEPRTASPQLRLNAVRQLSQAGIPVSVMMGPIVPGLTDHEINPILEAAAKAGAKGAYYTILRLPYGVKDIFRTWLSTHFPNKTEKVFNRLKEMRGGMINNHEFGKRMGGDGPYAEYIDQMFQLAKKRYGLHQDRHPLSSRFFQKPVLAKENAGTLESQQMRLF